MEENMVSDVKNLKSATIKHCKFCKEGRVIQNRREMVFCSLCGHEFSHIKMK